MFLMICQEHVSHLINRIRKEISMIKVFNKLFEHLTRGEYKEFFKLILVLFPFIAFFGIIIVLAINFASKHIQAIVFLTVAVVGLISWLLSPKSVSEPTEITTSQPKAVKPIQLQHQLVTEVMFNIFKSLSLQLHIQSPTFESQVKDRIPYYTDNATNVTYFRYSVIVSGEPLDEILFKEILNNGIIKALGISTSKLGRPVFEHDGNHFQKLIIDEASFTGATWLIVMAICDNDYAIVLENRAQTNEMISSNKDDFTFYNDRDF